MKYIDTHAHITSSYLEDNVDEVIIAAKQNKVEYIFIPGTTLEDSFSALECSKKYDFVFAGFGIHPSDSSDEITNKLDNQNFEGFKFIGETGIDLFHDSNPPLDVQVRSFKKHLDIARKLSLPVEVHTRDAYQEVYEVIKDYNDVKMIMHSFTGSYEWAKKFINLGAYISFSGIVTFKNATEIKDMMLKIPLERILIETDSPFLAPSPMRGKRNKPEFVKHIGDFIANERSEKNVLETIFDTTINIFNIK